MNQYPFAVDVQGRLITYKVLDAVYIDNQQVAIRANAVGVFVVAEHKLGVAQVGSTTQVQGEWEYGDGP